MGVVHNTSYCSVIKSKKTNSKLLLWDENLILNRTLIKKRSLSRI